jgi:hypothetical protein
MTRWFLILMTALGLTGCGYNDFQRRTTNQVRLEQELTPTSTNAAPTWCPTL